MFGACGDPIRNVVDDKLAGRCSLCDRDGLVGKLVRKRELGSQPPFQEVSAI